MTKDHNINSSLFWQDSSGPVHFPITFFHICPLSRLPAMAYTFITSSLGYGNSSSIQQAWTEHTALGQAVISVVGLDMRTMWFLPSRSSQIQGKMSPWGTIATAHLKSPSPLVIEFRLYTALYGFPARPHFPTCLGLVCSCLVIMSNSFATLWTVAR